MLADPSSAGAAYIDVTDPARPAAGVSEQAVAAAGLATLGIARRPDPTRRAPTGGHEREPKPQPPEG